MLLNSVYATSAGWLPQWYHRWILWTKSTKSTLRAQSRKWAHTCKNTHGCCRYKHRKLQKNAGILISRYKHSKLQRGSPPGWLIQDASEYTQYDPCARHADSGRILEMLCDGTMHRGRHDIAFSLPLGIVHRVATSFIAFKYRTRSSIPHQSNYGRGMEDPRKKEEYKNVHSTPRLSSAGNMHRREHDIPFRTVLPNWP